MSTVRPITKRPWCELMCERVNGGSQHSVISTGGCKMVPSSALALGGGAAREPTLPTATCVSQAPLEAAPSEKLRCSEFAAREPGGVVAQVEAAAEIPSARPSDCGSHSLHARCGGCIARAPDFTTVACSWATRRSNLRKQPSPGFGCASGRSNAPRFFADSSAAANEPSACRSKWGSAKKSLSNAALAVNLSCGRRLSAVRRKPVAAGDGHWTPASCNAFDGRNVGAGHPVAIAAFMSRGSYSCNLYGNSPNKKTYARAPIDHMSTLQLYRKYCTISGAMYGGVPQIPSVS
mmetsp:Transcript_108766/g.314057  ORF Transcript_108766/g.314057 Transcript_108766/m.314057 type:complete len:292 (-) Transcript_108766:730-1605(-)